MQTYGLSEKMLKVAIPLEIVLGNKDLCTKLKLKIG